MLSLKFFSFDMMQYLFFFFLSFFFCRRQSTGGRGKEEEVSPQQQNGDWSTCRGSTRRSRAGRSGQNDPIGSDRHLENVG